MPGEEILLNMSNIIDSDLISLHLKAKTKYEAIEELSELLLQHGDVRDKAAFIEDVVFRESEGVTGIGQGVAIPHGKSEAVERTTIAIGISDHLIPWESLDGEPVNAIILFAVRAQDSNVLHLKLLQRVAILLADDTFIQKLHQVSSKEELMMLLK
ncbi:PTS sugar transporter subunit IIA [Streptococcus ovis]|uniref:PTS sugar transporter subunit IIA n=1 Tax=Streptococcus ovis TaxID=82806 RepID=UPI0003653D75|nr:fructose PTS transporter subunit IIA [Streptococcus ovis]